jgi:hypothetical protein
MSDYIRTTRECSVNQLRPEILQAMRNFFRERELGDVGSDSLLCCETISRKKNDSKMTSLLGDDRDTTLYTGMLLTSQFLLWVHFGDRTGIRLNAAKLSEIQVEFHTSLFSKDVGLEIIGYISDARSRVRGYIGMGTEPAAQKFCEEVKQATLKAKPSTPKKWFGWPSG